MHIEDLRMALVSGVPVEYKAHCLKRMLERGISRKDIENCILNGEIIENYPLDETNNSKDSFPSCLILGVTTNDGEKLHVVVGYNQSMIIVITAYYPDIEHWEDDFKTRRNRYV